MVSLSFVFWLFVILAAIIGMLRGWAKELLVTVSVVLAIFVINVMEEFLPYLKQLFLDGGDAALLPTRAVVIILLAFFGYETPRITFLSRGAVREKIQDSILGFFIGAFNGYLIIGSLWYFLHVAGYPFAFVLHPNDPTVLAIIEPEALRSTEMLLGILPPVWLTPPLLYFGVAALFTLVVMAFI